MLWDRAIGEHYMRTFVLISMSMNSYKDEPKHLFFSHYPGIPSAHSNRYLEAKPEENIGHPDFVKLTY